MTPDEWEKSDDPRLMLEWLTATSEKHGHGWSSTRLAIKPRASDRKLRLFACACCRSVWPLLADERCRKCIEAAEKYADDPSAPISPYYGDAAERFEEMDNSGQGELWNAVLARHVCNTRDGFAGDVSGTIVPAALRKERTTPALLADLAREIFGNPWKPCRRFGNAVCDSTMKELFVVTEQVMALATAAYERRATKPCKRCINGRLMGNPDCEMCEGYGRVSDPDSQYVDGTMDCPRCDIMDCPDCNGGVIETGTLDNARLAILSDALEDEGCTDTALLTHLRSDGPHYRGCHALDLVLNKE